MSLAARKKEYRDYSFKPKKNQKKSRLLTALSLIALSFLTSILLSLAISVFFRASMTADSFVCNGLQEKMEAYIAEEQRLKMKVALLSSPSRIEEIALKKNMDKPEKVYFLQLDDETYTSYSFKKPSLRLKSSGWLDDLLDRVVYIKADTGIFYGSQ